eukprot:scaffold46147_cov53-Attheya_sp.AAC.3
MEDDEAVNALCPSWAISVGYLGVASAACLSNWGSAVSRAFSDIIVHSHRCRQPGSAVFSTRE